MLLKLIFTTIACASVSAPTLKNHKNAYIGNTLVLSGQYAFNDTFDYDSFYNLIDKQNDRIALTVEGQITTGDIEIFCFDPNGTSKMAQMDYLALDYDSDDYTFKVRCYDESGNYYLNTDWLEESDLTDIDDI